jgi:ribonucleoside-diphosphate reductase alpha chain
MATIHGIEVDYSRDSLFDELGVKRLKESYMRSDETSPQERFAYVSKAFSSNAEHAQRLYEYSSKHWLSYSTPILSFGRSSRGLPISCFTGDVEVNTISGPKKISKVVIGDKVLSHDNTYNEVTNVSSSVSSEIYELEYREEKFRVTGNHLILAREAGSSLSSNKWVRVDCLDSDIHTLISLTPVVESTPKFYNFTVKKVDASELVYDIEVANTHTFTVGSSKLVAHNCFLSYLDDSAEGLVNTLSEVNWLSMLGGGVGLGVGIRSADDKSVGVMPHLRTYDASSLAYRQGSTRRGSYAAYLDISHPDISMFLDMRKPTGDPNMRAMNLHHGVNITDDFMHIIEKCMIDKNADDSWELKDPHSQEVREVVSARHLWQQILELRMQTGEPYIHFIDTSNKHLPEFQKKLGLKVRQSNLCSEIILATDKERTAVCCLSSINLEYYDDFKDNELFFQDIAEMLDNVLEYFITNAPDTISRARYSARRERSIGVGALGFHAYLQKNNIPWESPMAVGRNVKMFKHMRESLDTANLFLGKTRGEAPDCVGTGRRFAHTSAVAPNASSSIIMGNTSPSVEPYRANVYRQDTLSGAHLNKNRFLDKVILKEAEKHKSEWYDETWSSIIANDGSVQHLEWMDDWTKDVFKTSMEIDQRWVIQHAADRQPFIDQGQSINVFFRPDAHIKLLHAVHFQAWKQGLKTLYYCRSEKIGKADKVSKKIERQIIEELDLKALVTEDVCLACE